MITALDLPSTDCRFASRQPRVQVATLDKSFTHMLSIKRSLTTTALQALVQAFVYCRLDYCNALLAGVADVHLKCLQSVQNAAARLVSASRRCDPITPVLTRLHWLPVRQRIAFKTAVQVWKAQHGAAPVYLSDFCVPVATVSGRQQLRSVVDCWSPS